MTILYMIMYSSALTAFFSSENPLCGRKFYTSESGEGGIIYLNDYNNSMECNYEIETRPLFTISLLISKMDIELSAGCQFDALSVSVTENSDVNSRKIYKCCIFFLFFFFCIFFFVWCITNIMSE